MVQLIRSLVIAIVLPHPLDVTVDLLRRLSYRGLHPYLEQECADARPICRSGLGAVLFVASRVMESRRVIAFHPYWQPGLPVLAIHDALDGRQAAAAGPGRARSRKIALPSAA